MNIEKIVVTETLYEFIIQHLPESLEAYQEREGYGLINHICLRPIVRKWYGKQFTTIADVDRHTIKLYHPQFFSDMKRLGELYEEHTGKEVTLRYWEEK